MSTPQNPYSGSDAENNQNITNDQLGPDTNRVSPASDEVSPDSNSTGSQFSQAEQYSQTEQYNEHQTQFASPNPQGQQYQYNPGGEYNQGGQYNHGGQYDPQNQYGEFEQPAQQGQYSQDAGYAAYGQGNYAGSQHAPVGNFQQPAAQQKTGGSGGFFKSLFDFRFDNFIAVRWAGFIYIIAIVVAALSWLGSIIGGIVTGAAAGSASAYFGEAPSFSPWPLLLAIIFGWIIPALWVIFVRLALELIVANVKTAENTKQIADSLRR
ncbi:DUF4282 domain-containing protein [Brevibacterium zhoupengii]|uniref:DUF4282 domain-containing protein n=1 Tax=Brevibacterium zhoupengii TaxID=2898795 RepID=UPI001E4ECD7B|nr:DUF4282 domain-containing protein [Brevibacterium zhoupengii]